MNTFAITITTLIVGLVGSAGVHAANDIQLQRLGICQDRWVDWKDDAVRLERFENFFKTEFEEMAPDGAFVPKLPTRVFGWPVVQVYPQSIGMGIGFSVKVQANHAQAQVLIEKQLRKRMECTNSEGVRACSIELGNKKIAMLLSEQNGQAQTSIFGCFYFYQH